MLSFRFELDGVAHRVPMRAGTVRVGSAGDAEVRVDSPHVSRYHVQVAMAGAELEIRDLGSLNGTFVDGEPITLRRARAPVQLRLGRSVEVLIRDDDTDDLLLSPLVEAGSQEAVPSRDGPTVSYKPGQVPPGIQQLGTNLLREMATVELDRLEQRLVELLAAAGAAQAMLLRGTERPIDPARAVLRARVGESFQLPPAAWRQLRGALDDEVASGTLDGGELGPITYAAAHAGQGVSLLAWRGDEAHPIPPEPLSSALALWQRLEPTLPAVEPERARAFDLGRAGFVAGASAVMRDLHSRLAGTAGSDLPVLITGETGTGKDVYARAIHRLSRRGEGPFQAINSSAIPESLLESLLFGAEAGVATGLSKQAGLIRSADGGTFFFDEIGEMPVTLQAKLLRVLDERWVLPVGGTRPVSIDVRFVAATNRNLARAVEEGTFREDLLHRLSGHEFELPPLRARRDDVAPLVNSFLREEVEKIGRPFAGVTIKAMAALESYRWPGNVRELRATVRRLVHEIPAGTLISFEHLPAKICEAPVTTSPDGSLEERLEAVRAEAIRAALSTSGGNKARAAVELGISRGGLRIMMKRLGIE